MFLRLTTFDSRIVSTEGTQLRTEFYDLEGIDTVAERSLPMIEGRVVVVPRGFRRTPP